jgi:hypothetical protein
VASSKALDVLHQAMHPTSYHCICITIKIASDSPEFFNVVGLLLATTVANDYVIVNIN